VKPESTPCAQALAGTSGTPPAIDFAAVVQQAAEAIVTLDLDGQVTSWNGAAEALLGHRSAEIMGIPAPHLLPAGRVPAIGRRITVRRHSNGRAVQLIAAVAALQDPAGMVIGWTEMLTPLPETTGVAAPDDAELAPALAMALEKGELLLPSQFIQCAEREGLIGAIGLFVLRGACAQIAAWRRGGVRVLPISVNVSGHQFRLADFASSFAAAIEESGIDPHWLKLEITESAIVEDPDTAAARLDELRAIGVGIAIDDFGVGYSSLSRLRQYHIDTLKLDQTFLRDIADDAIAREVAGTVIRLAHRLGMTVVAEGIETEAHCATLLELGCDCGQVFLLARPLPGSDIPALT